jgi:quercetin dioxygenase-like cupin family protein
MTCSSSFLGLPTLLRATGDTTNGAFGLIEQPVVLPGFASPDHVHHREDESFYVLQGSVVFVCDGKWITAGPGDFVFGPRNIPHGFKVMGTTPAHMLLLVTPGGFERFTRDLSEPADKPPSPRHRKDRRGGRQLRR